MAGEDLDARILTKLDEYIEHYLDDAEDASQVDDKNTFAALVQARSAHKRATLPQYFYSTAPHPK